MRVMQNFDTHIASVLGEKVKARTSFKGHLDTYRFCDEVWTFVVRDCHFKMEGNAMVDVPRVKIVACLAREKAGG